MPGREASLTIATHVDWTIYDVGSLKTRRDPEFLMGRSTARAAAARREQILAAAMLRFGQDPSRAATDPGGAASDAA